MLYTFYISIFYADKPSVTIGCHTLQSIALWNQLLKANTVTLIELLDDTGSLIDCHTF